MRLKLALSCLFGISLLLVSTDPITNLRDTPFEKARKASWVKVALASLPAPKDFIGPIIAPAKPDPDAKPEGDADRPIEAPKETRTPTSLERAQAALAESNAQPLSRNELCSSLVEVAQQNELPLGFFTNLIWRESRFEREAISPVGAMGIAQFMPDTAERMGLGDAFDGREALPASGKLLRTLADRFGNIGLAAAAYNAGPKRVVDWLQQRSGLPKETRDYVSLITGKPIEAWRGVKSKAVVFNVPRAVPCHRSAHFAAIEQSERVEQLQRVAEERRLAELARAEQRRLEKARLAQLRAEKAEKAREALMRAKKSRTREIRTASRSRGA
jgi:hypothetical protein